MVRVCLKILLVVLFIFYLFHYAAFALYELTDSFFYWEFAHFLETGKYFLPHPYYYTTPSTIEPPLYSLFLFLVQSFAMADRLIHAVQIFLLFISAFLLYRVTRSRLGTNGSLAVTVLYLFIPSHIFFVSALMTEIFAVAAATGFVYLAWRACQPGHRYYAPFLALYAAGMTLLRYNFLSFYIISLGFFLLRGHKRLRDWFVIAGSMAILVGWIGINHRLNGAWGLTNVDGKHLYNRVVAGDHLTPATSNPAWIRLQKLLPSDRTAVAPWWTFEEKIIQQLGDEQRVNDLLKKIAIAAIWHNPVRFSVNTVVNMMQVHGNGIPFADDLEYGGRWISPSACRSLGTISFCQPIIRSTLTPIVWNWLVKISVGIYQYIPQLIYLFLLGPSLFLVWWIGDDFLKLCTIVYIAYIGLTSIGEYPVFRYLYPMYPVQVLLISGSIWPIIFQRRHRKQRSDS